ncbi:MAG: proline racemase family protein [Acidimicrobiia bacterium]
MAERPVSFPNGTRLTVGVDDFHTAGEPFRIVTSGGPELRGATVLDKRSDALARFDDLRAFVVNEPRGHADMYGCFVTQPDDNDGDLGVVFFHKDGFSTACGHGTIALAAWALRTGRVAVTEPVTELVIDVPSGRLRVEADVSEGRVGQIRFTNVPSWVSALDVPVTIPLDGTQVELTLDVAYGGALYASVPAAAIGASVGPADLARLIDVARCVKAALADHISVSHPGDDRLSGLYGVIFHEDIAAPPQCALAQRNVTVFADGEVDRSPCGSGTSARLAVLHARNQLATGETLHHAGIAGGVFTAKVTEILVGAGPNGNDAFITQVGGHAYPTGSATFVLDPADPIGLGFQLR